MWFTTRECTHRDSVSFLTVYVSYVALSFVQVRQVLSEIEIGNIELLITIMASAGFLFVIYVLIVKLHTQGCLGINELWFIAGVIVGIATVIINQITYQVASPVSMIAWFFFYPALTIRAEGKDAARGAALASLVLLMFGVISFAIVSSSWWWGIDWWYVINYLGEVQFGSYDWFYGMYQFNIVGIMVTSIFGSLATLILPVGFGDYVLPGYWVWRYRDTAIIAIVVIAIDLLLIHHGGLLRTVVNMGFGQVII